MSIKKLLVAYTPEELAESFIFPVKLAAKQKTEADIQLKEARAKTQSEMTEKDRLVSMLLQFRFRLEDYLNNKGFDARLTFSYFLKEYVNLVSKKRKDFAEEISIDETLLSQFINTHRMPPDYMAIRLELHSNNIIPAEYWYRLVEKEKEHQIKTDKTLRKKEMKYVHSTLAVAV